MRLGANGRAAILYTLTVKNNGPDAAAGVTVVDAAPGGVVFSSVTQPTQGTCSIQSSGTILGCGLGTIGSGSSVSIMLRATVSSTGTFTNTAFTTTTTPETIGDNNHASAKTLVVASATPPRTRPLAVVEMCSRVTVGPKMLKANGKEQTIRATVTQGAKGVSGVALRITGPGISRMVRSSAGGVVLVHLTTRQPGILKVAIVGKKACDTQRIGVVGTYEPPVTG